MHNYQVLGIDVGKDSFHLSYPLPADHPKDWPAIQINYDHADWWQTFQTYLIPSVSVLAVELTGFHWFAPIATVVFEIATNDITIWNVHGKTTRNARAVHISRHKTDDMDARTLALIATWIVAGDIPIGAHVYNHATENHVQALRLHLNAYERAVRQSTALSNRLTSFRSQPLAAISPQQEHLAQRRQSRRSRPRPDQSLN